MATNPRFYRTIHADRLPQILAFCALLLLCLLFQKDAQKSI
jgi:hypothetical protein